MEKVIVKFRASLGAQSRLLLMYAKNLKKRSFKNLPRSGRPRTLATPRAEPSVITELRQNRFASLRKISTNVCRKLKFEKLSVNIARKVIKKYKYASCIRKKRSCITITPINRRCRLAWVKAVTPWTECRRFGRCRLFR